MHDGVGLAFPEGSRQGVEIQERNEVKIRSRIDGFAMARAQVVDYRNSVPGVRQHFRNHASDIARPARNNHSHTARRIPAGNLAGVLKPRIGSPGSIMRELLNTPPLIAPGVYDAITARIAEASGAKALYLSGAGVTNSMTAMPDIAMITMDEMARQAAYVTGAVRIPVFADADTGYGEAWNVMRTVTEFERAGLAGLHLEDQVSPKRCGHLGGKSLITADDMAAKIRAAAHARSNPSFFIIARTDARGVDGLDTAVERAKRYVDAGADCIFPEGLESSDEFAAFRERVTGPLLANMTEFGRTPLITAAEFGRLGYEIVIFPMTAFRVMMKAVEEAYQTLLRTGTQAELIDKMRTRQELYDLIRYRDYELLDKKLAE